MENERTIKEERARLKFKPIDKTITFFAVLGTFIFVLYSGPRPIWPWILMLIAWLIWGEFVGRRAEVIGSEE